MKKEEAIQLFKDCLNKIEQEDLTIDEGYKELDKLPLSNNYAVFTAHKPDEGGTRDYTPVEYSLKYKKETVFKKQLSVCNHLKRDKRFTRSGK